MSEFPQLRESLVRAAARRRRRRIVVRAAVPSFALAAAAVAVLALPGEAPREREGEVATPPPALTELEASFGVFRRPRTAADEVPANIGGGMIEGPQWENSRLLARTKEDRFYAVPSTEGMCLIVLREGKSVSSMCGSVEQFADEKAAAGSVARGMIAFLFPDGTRDVRVTLSNGENWGFPRLPDNGLLARGTFGLLSYTGPSGVRYIYGPRQQRPDSFTSRCPNKLRPLPADAEELAVGAALRTVEYLYPGVRRATGKAAKPLEAPCGAAIADRTIEVRLQLSMITARNASLAQGRVLVGMVDDKMQVFYVLH